MALRTHDGRFGFYLPYSRPFVGAVEAIGRILYGRIHAKLHLLREKSHSFSRRRQEADKREGVGKRRPVFYPLSGMFQVRQRPKLGEFML